MILNKNLKTFNTFVFCTFKFQNYMGEKKNRNHNSSILKIKKQGF